MSAHAFAPTPEMRRMVETMAACGVPQEHIARVVAEGGITDKTLRKHFREELDTGGIKANALIAQSLFQQAKSGNMTAMIFWLKTRAGWKETTVNEHGGNVTINVKTGIKRDVVPAD